MTGVRLTARYRFSASHRLATPALSAEDNREIYGKCNNPYGHGHDYVLEVSVAGPLDLSGRVAPVSALDDLVNRHVIRDFEHRNLNVDVPDFAACAPTSENIALAIRERLTEHWSERF